MTDLTDRINAYLANEKGYEATTTNRLLAEARDELKVLEAHVVELETALRRADQRRTQMDRSEAARIVMERRA